jgi:uncharacterized Zn finger protein
MLQLTWECPNCSSDKNFKQKVKVDATLEAFDNYHCGHIFTMKCKECGEKTRFELEIKLCEENSNIDSTLQDE